MRSASAESEIVVSCGLCNNEQTVIAKTYAAAKRQVIQLDGWSRLTCDYTGKWVICRACTEERKAAGPAEGIAA